MSIRSARINILVSPEEKLAIEAMAAERDLSVSQHMREAAMHFDEDLYAFNEEDLTQSQKVELFMLAEQVSDMVGRLEKKLDDSWEEILKMRKAHNAFRLEHDLSEI